MTPQHPAILAPFSALYGAAVRIRSELYRRQLRKPAKLAATVISIGNITAGGTGKTPLVEYVARIAAECGRKVCVLTRGYGRHGAANRVIVSDGSQILANVRTGGDEPCLLAANLRGLAAVISDADRHAAGNWAIENFGSDLFILDDGFQHLQLQRQLNILVIDGSQPWGGNHLLPWGRLREPPSAIQRADCLIVSRTDQSPELEELQAEIRRFTSKPILLSKMRLRGIQRLGEEGFVTSDELPQPFAILCAIGNPASFVEHVTISGHSHVIAKAFPDHHYYTQSDLDSFAETARSAGAKAILTTAKDAVKLPELETHLPCYIFDVEIEFSDSENFRRIVVETIQS